MERSKPSVNDISEDEIKKLVPQKRLSQFYEIQNEIGEGGFGRVFKVLRISDQKNFAAKLLMNPPSRNDVNEARMMNGLDNEFLLKTEDFFINTDEERYL